MTDVETPAAPETARTPVGVARGVLKTMRPRQWVKNVLVFAAPFVGGDLLTPGIIPKLLIAFVAFSLAASGIYLVNDANDVTADRAHPTKRFRPIAAGIVAPRLAIGVAVVLLLAALGVSLLASRPLAITLAVYVAVQLSYCFWLKHQAVLDICIVASGFLLRAIAGGAATGIPLSQWFLLVAGFGSLFMVAGKRYSELVVLGDEAATRKSLREYSASYLRFVWSTSAGVTVTVYSLWAFEIGRTQDGVPWSTISIAPFVLGLLRHAVDLDRGTAGAPEEVVLNDKVLLVLGTVWLGIVGLGVFLD